MRAWGKQREDGCGEILRDTFLCLGSSACDAIVLMCMVRGDGQGI